MGLMVLIIFKGETLVCCYWPILIIDVFLFGLFGVTLPF